MKRLEESGNTFGEKFQSYNEEMMYSSEGGTQKSM